MSCFRAVVTPIAATAGALLISAWLLYVSVPAHLFLGILATELISCTVGDLWNLAAAAFRGQGWAQASGQRGGPDWCLHHLSVNGLTLCPKGFHILWFSESAALEMTSGEYPLASFGRNVGTGLTGNLLSRSGCVAKEMWLELASASVPWQAAAPAAALRRLSSWMRTFSAALAWAAPRSAADPVSHFSTSVLQPSPVGVQEVPLEEMLSQAQVRKVVAIVSVSVSMTLTSFVAVLTFVRGRANIWHFGRTVSRAVQPPSRPKLLLVDDLEVHCGSSPDCPICLESLRPAWAEDLDRAGAALWLRAVGRKCRPRGQGPASAALRPRLPRALRGALAAAGDELPLLQAGGPRRRLRPPVPALAWARRQQPPRGGQGRRRGAPPLRGRPGRRGRRGAGFGWGHPGEVSLATRARRGPPWREAAAAAGPPRRAAPCPR
ncbi:unnamed protein product [Prorocentrum cordatum]|uniref:Uncharacterized protein n=1 Tax=Prorocentrum cordatum TaxID=2364126 RepID=A0ABN9RU66_9DINO|nr:unnamed protein product [Polarella glacialis]